MRPWAVPIGFVGAAISGLFWLVVPLVAGSNNVYVHAGNEPFYVVFAVLSLLGIAGALMAPRSSRLAPALMAIAIIPGIAALLLPGLMLTVAGLVAGTAAAFAVTRLVSSMLVNVGAADPVTFGGVAVFLVLVALGASYVPARRATRVDPMVALRCE